MCICFLNIYNYSDFIYIHILFRLVFSYNFVPADEFLLEYSTSVKQSMV